MQIRDGDEQQSRAAVLRVILPRMRAVRDKTSEGWHEDHPIPPSPAPAPDPDPGEKMGNASGLVFVEPWRRGAGAQGRRGAGWKRHAPASRRSIRDPFGRSTLGRDPAP